MRDPLNIDEATFKKNPPPPSGSLRTRLRPGKSEHLVSSSKRKEIQGTSARGGRPEKNRGLGSRYCCSAIL